MLSCCINSSAFIEKFLASLLSDDCAASSFLTEFYTCVCMCAYVYVRVCERVCVGHTLGKLAEICVMYSSVPGHRNRFFDPASEFLKPVSPLNRAKSGKIGHFQTFEV